MAKNALMTDPYAALRKLPANAFQWQEAQGAWQDANAGDAPRYYDATPAQWGFGQGAPALEGTPFQSKYGDRISGLDGGRVGLTLQQPGAHKYDTMMASYAPDPVTGEWVLQGDPMDSKTREVSYGEEFRDNVELAGKGVLAAGALYGAGLGLSSGIEALGGGGAEALGEAGGYDFMSGEGAGELIELGGPGISDGSFVGDISGQSLPQDFSGVENVNANPTAGMYQEVGGGIVDGNAYGGTQGGNNLMSGIGDFFSGNSSMDSYLRAVQLLGGLYAQNKATGAAQDGNNAQNALLAQMYQQNRTDNQPLLDTRNSALTQINGLLKDPNSITQQPGYQFGLKQGANQLNNRAAASGNYYSGAQMKAAQQYGQDYAGTKLDQSLNRLTAVAGLGQVGANNNQTNNTNFGTQGGNALQQGGNIRAGGYLGGFTTANNAANGWIQDQYDRKYWGGGK